MNELRAEYLRGYKDGYNYGQELGIRNGMIEARKEINSDQTPTTATDYDNLGKSGKFDYVLIYCHRCQSMTNHLGGICQKCKGGSDD